MAKTERQQLIDQWQALSRRIAELGNTFEDMPFEQADAMICRLQAELEALQRKTLIRMAQDDF